MFFLGRDLAKRLGIWALIQALPNEATLKAYLRDAYLGLAGVIIGSVLTGGAFAAGLALGYHLLVEQGWPETQVLIGTIIVGVAIIAICFFLAAHWFTRLASVKHDAGMFSDVPRDILGGAFNTLVEGFLEGMTESREAERRKEEWRQAKVNRKKQKHS
jgi:hypothetical protein